MCSFNFMSWQKYTINSKEKWCPLFALLLLQCILNRLFILTYILKMTSQAQNCSLSKRVLKPSGLKLADDPRYSASELWLCMNTVQRPCCVRSAFWALFVFCICRLSWRWRVNKHGRTPQRLGPNLTKTFSAVSAELYIPLITHTASLGGRAGSLKVTKTHLWPQVWLLFSDLFFGRDKSKKKHSWTEHYLRCGYKLAKTKNCACCT